MPDNTYQLSERGRQIVETIDPILDNVERVAKSLPPLAQINSLFNLRRPQIDEVWIGKIVSQAAGAGNYFAKSIFGAARKPTSTLTETDLGTITNTTDTVFLCLSEVGNSTSQFSSSNAYAMGQVRNIVNGYLIVVGFVIPIATCE